VIKGAKRRCLVRDLKTDAPYQLVPINYLAKSIGVSRHKLYDLLFDSS